MWDVSIGWLVALCSAAVAWSYKRDVSYEAEESKAIRNSLLQTQTALKSAVSRHQEAAEQIQLLQSELRVAKSATGSARKQANKVSEQLEGKQIHVNRLQKQVAEAAKQNFAKERLVNDVNVLKQENATLVQELSDRAATHTEELQRALSDATAAAAAGQAKLHDTEQQAATAAAIASQEYADQQQCLTAQIQQAKRAAQLKGKAMDELVAQHAEQLGQLHITQQQLQQQVLEHTNQLQQELSVHDEAKTCLGQLQADHDTLKASHSLMLQEAEALNKSKFDLSAKLQQQESANDTISDQMENMKTEQQTSQAIIHSMQEQVAKHKEASSQTQQQITELQSNAAELQQQLAARPKQADLDSIISERDNLQLQLSGRSVINKQLEEVNTQYAAAQKQLQEHDSLRKQLDMLQEQLQERDDAVMQLQHLPADLDEAVLQAKQITAERDAALSEITKLHKQLSEAASQDVMDQLESLTETAERQVQEYQQEHAQLLQQFQADFAKAQAEHQDMYRSQLQEYQAVADSKQADAEQAQELLSDKAAEVSTLQQQLRQQSHDLQASCEKLAQAEIDHLQHAQHLREELSTTMQDRQDLLAKLARLQAQVAGTEAEADASADTCKALQQQLLGTATSSDSNVHSRDLVHLTISVHQGQSDGDVFIKDLKQQLLDRQAINEQLQQQLVAQEARVQELQTNTAQQNIARAEDGTTVHPSDNQVSDAKQQMARQHQSQSQLQKQLASAERELSAAKSKAELWQIDAQQAFRQRDETQTALNRVQTDLAASLADVSSVQTDLAAGAFDLAKANTNLAAVQTDLAAANTEARVLLHMCQQLQKQANNSACASVHLQATLKQCEQHRRDLTAVLDGKEADLAAANTEARYLLHMCTELQKQAGQQQATKDALFKARADRAVMQQQVQTLTLKVESVREAAANAASAKKAADLSIARERFQKNVKAALKEKAKVEDELHIAQQQLSTLQKNISSSETQLAGANKELADAKNQLSSNQEQLQEAHEDLKDARAKLDSTQGRLSNAHQELSSAAEELATSRHELSSCQEQLSNAETQLSSAQQQLSDAQASLMTKEAEVQELQEASDNQKADIEILSKDRDDMRQEVMQKLEQFRALNKELSEHKNTGKGLQEQLDQLRSIREVQAGYDASSRSDYDDQAPSLLNSPQPKELQSTSNPGSRSAGSQTAAGVPSPADLSSAFAAAHSSQISSSAHNSPQLPGSAVEDANTAAEPSENQHNAAVELRGSPVIQADIDEHSALSDSPVGQDQAKSSTMGAAEMQVTDALEASTSSNAEATSLHMPTSASSPHSDASSSSKENRPDLNFSSSNDKAHSTGAPLTVRVRMAALTDNPDHISVDLKAGEVDDTAHENAHKDADDTEDAFAADTDETLTASQASESGLSRQGSLSGLSSFAPTPTSHLSEVSDGWQMRHPFASQDTPPVSRLPLSSSTPPASPLPSSAALMHSRRHDSTASLASMGSTPRSVRQGVQSQSGYNLSVASMFQKPST